MPLVIGINGTPGSGKTTISQILGKKGRHVINLGEFSRQHNCVIEYDAERKCDVIDDELLEEKLRKFIPTVEGTLIIEGHLADIIPEEYLDRCFVLEVKIPDLISRLEKREYTKEKIEENKIAELFKECYINSLDTFGQERVELVPPLSLEEVVEHIEKYIRRREEEIQVARAN